MHTLAIRVDAILFNILFNIYCCMDREIDNEGLQKIDSHCFSKQGIGKVYFEF